MKALGDYSFRPGEPGVATERWPEDSGLSRSQEHFTLVVGLHPECPCSRATAAQLERILAHTAGKLRVVAVFDDRSSNVAMENSDLFGRLRAQGQVLAINDRDGAELNRFGFRTSGDTRLYAPDGRLVFHGGITASRGHEGDNAGQSAVLAAVADGVRDAVPIRMPVFGCSLRCE